MSHVQELRPTQDVIHVIFHLVVFGEATQVCVLHVKQVVELGSSDVHCLWFGFERMVIWCESFFLFVFLCDFFYFADNEKNCCGRLGAGTRGELLRFYFFTFFVFVFAAGT